ncbi:hypothetical protein GCM10010528_13460 [Gordonia defluvii]|uniref:DUF4878 domain-containing protein n=1 Tax=Gordonia defluvii TaxID=283718 RepID=A0ABP6LA25_9ACTN|nr:hypothetical protein [Gordonia sp. UBA5067]
MADSPDDDMGQSSDELDRRDAPTRGPIIAALAVVVVLIGLILIPQWLHPFASRVSDEDSVRMAVNNHYTAQNALNYDTFTRWTCAAKLPPRDEFLTRATASRDVNGPIVIPPGKIADVAINGDRASATVSWHYGKKTDAVTTTATTLVRQDNQWKVC